MRLRVEHPFLLSCCLLAALFFDGTGILHCCVGAMLLHEGGHVLLYLLLLRRVPLLRLRLGGAALQWGGLAPGGWCEAAILLAGPLANLLAAVGFLAAALRTASYARYFWGGANLLLGAFNLLPLGFLDGGRLLELLLGRFLPWHWVWRVCGLAQWLCLGLLTVLLVCSGASWATRLALLCFLGYYCGKSFFAR